MKIKTVEKMNLPELIEALEPELKKFIKSEFCEVTEV